MFQGLPLGDSQSLTPTSSSSGRLSRRLLGVDVYPDLTQLRRGTTTNPRKLSGLLWVPEEVLQEGLGANTEASP